MKKRLLRALTLCVLLCMLVGSLPLAYATDQEACSCGLDAHAINVCNHSYGSWVKTPTTHTGTCSKCGMKYIGQHQFENIGGGRIGCTVCYYTVIIA